VHSEAKYTVVADANLVAGWQPHGNPEPAKEMSGLVLIWTHHKVSFREE
jgi:hypothetical protein